MPPTEQPGGPRWATVPRTRTIAAALLAATLAVGCSSGSDEPKAKPGVTGQSVEADQLRLQVTAATSVSPHRASGPVDGPTSEAVLEVVQKTFDATVTAPLAEGKLGSLQGVFADDVAARASGPDLGAVFDAGLGKPSYLELDKGDVALMSLSGDGDRPALVVARIDWDLRSPERDLRVQRVGELTLEPAFGTWLVTGYSILTTRTRGDATTTTTAAH